MEEQYIACVPCLDGFKHGFKPYKDSCIGECEECGVSVWIGPECAKKLESKNFKVWCMPCLAQKYGYDAVQQNMRPLTDKGAGD